MLKKLTRSEAHKAMDDGKTLYSHDKKYRVYRADTLAQGPYVAVFNFAITDRYFFDFDLFIEVEDPWRPVEGEAVYAMYDGIWVYAIHSHYSDIYKMFFTTNGTFKIIAPVKGNEGSAGTTRKLKNTLTAEDLK